MTFARLEYITIACINDLNCRDLKTRDFALTACLVGGEKLTVLISKFMKILRTKTTNRDLIIEFETICGKIETENTKRGTFIHSHLLMDKNTARRWKPKMSMPKKNVIGIVECENVSIDEMRTTANKAYALGTELSELLFTHRDKILEEYNRRLKSN